MACKNCWGCLGIYSVGHGEGSWLPGTTLHQELAVPEPPSRWLCPVPRMEHHWARTPLSTPDLSSSCSTAWLCWNTTGNRSLEVLSPDLGVLQGNVSHAPGLKGKETLTGSCMAEGEAGPASSTHPIMWTSLQCRFWKSKITSDCTKERNSGSICPLNHNAHCGGDVNVAWVSRLGDTHDTWGGFLLPLGALEWQPFSVF